MMINKRLIGLVPSAVRHVTLNVACQFLSLLANVVLIASFASIVTKAVAGTADMHSLLPHVLVIVLMALIRYLLMRKASRESYLSSAEVKKRIRQLIYGKLLKIGPSYTQKTTTASVVQLSGEGAEQLETYFGSYLPQFFYSMLSPLVLFIIVSFISLRSAIILFICVPLIPMSIVVVQKIAKRLLSRYWGQYEALADSFLENLQGLTTLKIYSADEKKQEEMNAEAEHFRKVTMKVLTMQLNSIIVMDIVAYGGAALGIISAALAYLSGEISLFGTIMIILLSADFFLPMRMLGSYFHIAMNGMAAADRIFALLDVPETAAGEAFSGNGYGISAEELGFSYDGSNDVLHSVAFSVKSGSFTSIAGESGCGKSTIAAILTGRAKPYSGSLTIGGQEISRLSDEALSSIITLVSHDSYIFSGTVRENLLMAAPEADDEKLWKVLERVNLDSFLRSEGSLDLPLLEGGSNLSGGQKQRLAIARALLHDSPVYIFDEATSNIDSESEDEIMQIIHTLAGEHTVIVISHRLANITASDEIYMMEHGRIIEHGTHEQLLASDDEYARMYLQQKALENLEEAAL